MSRSNLMSFFCNILLKSVENVLGKEDILVFSKFPQTSTTHSEHRAEGEFIMILVMCKRKEVTLCFLH